MSGLIEGTLNSIGITSKTLIFWYLSILVNYAPLNVVSEKDGNNERDFG